MKPILTHLPFLFLFFFAATFAVGQCPDEVTPINTTEIACSYENPVVPDDAVILAGVDNPEHAIVIWDPAIYQPVVVEGGCAPQVLTFSYTIGCELDPDLMIPGGQHSVETYPVIEPPVVVVVSNNGVCDYSLITCPTNTLVPSEVDPNLEEQVFTVTNANGCSEDFLVTIPPCPASFGLEGISYLDYAEPFYQTSQTGVICYTYEIPLSASHQVLNVCLKDSDDNEYWSVRNLILEPFDGLAEQCVYFDLGPIIAVEGGIPATLDIGYLVSEGVQVSKPTITDFQEISLFPWEVDFGPGLVSTDLTVSVSPPTELTDPVFDPGDLVDYVERGCKVPNIDLDSTGHPPSSTYAGDWNACGPASTANSFRWLGDQHPEIGDKLKAKYGEGTAAHRALLEAMSDKMNRADGEGVSEEQMLKGKLGLIDDCELPMKVKFQSIFTKTGDVNSPNLLYGHQAENQSETAPSGQPNANISMDWILQEMKDGEDVELNIQWYNPDSNKYVAGHAVVVTGIEKVGDDWKISFKDDTRQETSTPDGLRHATTNAIVIPADFPDPYFRGMILLPELSVGNNFAFIGTVYSESYDDEISFEPLLDIKGLFTSQFISPFNYDDPELVTIRYSYLWPESLPDVVWMSLLLSNDDTTIVVVENTALHKFDFTQTITTYGFFPDFVSNADIAITVLLDEAPMESYPDPKPQDTLSVGTFTHDYGGEREATTTGTASELSDLDSLVADLSREDTVTASVRRGCAVPNLDLDDSQHPATADYAGDWNACAPTSTANSFQWLRDSFPVIDSLLTPPFGDDEESLREMMEEFSNLMGRDAAGEGVSGLQQLQGKLALIDRYRLPIRVKFQSAILQTGNVNSPNRQFGHFARNESDSSTADAPNGTISMEWILQEMEDGEDVELGIDWYDTDSMRYVHGHAVVLTDIVRIDDTVWQIHFKDDAQQEATNEDSLRHLQCDVVVVPADFPYPEFRGMIYLPKLRRGNRYPFVRDVFSESFDSTITYPEVKVKSVGKTSYAAPFNNTGTDLATIKFTYQLPELGPDILWLDIYLITADTAIRAVQNAPLSKFEDSLTVTTFGYVPGLIDLSQIVYYKVVGTGRTTGHGLTLSDLPEGLDTISLGDVGYRIGAGYLADAFNYTGPLPETEEPPADEVDTLFSVTRNCAVPNIDLDHAGHPPTAEYAGDWNACAPASTANSFQWLRDSFPEIDSLIKERFGEDDSVSWRQMMEAFSGHMGRDTAGDGANTRGVIEGKLGLIDDLKLPVRVKFQSIFDSLPHEVPSPDQRYGHSAENQSRPSQAGSPNSNISLLWIYQEMARGEDVELGIHWIHPNPDSPAYGHAVVLTDIIRTDTGWHIYFKDDGDQAVTDPDSLRYVFTEMRRVPSTHADSFFRRMIELPNLRLGPRKAYVTSVFSESYDSTVTYCPDTLTLNDTIVTPGIYSAEYELRIQSVVDVGTPVIFQSAGEVRIEPGGAIPKGQDALLRIADCGDESPADLLSQQDPPAAQTPPAVEFQTEPLQPEAQDGPRQLTLFPNPAYEQLNFVFDRPFQTEQKLLIRIFDNMGSLMHSQESLSVQQGQIDIAALPAGLYFIRIDWPDGKVTGRFVKL